MTGSDDTLVKWEILEVLTRKSGVQPPELKILFLSDQTNYLHLYYFRIT